MRGARGPRNNKLNAETFVLLLPWRGVGRLFVDVASLDGCPALRRV
jgi:hypothetical protein